MKLKTHIILFGLRVATSKDHNIFDQLTIVCIDLMLVNASVHPVLSFKGQDLSSQ